MQQRAWWKCVGLVCGATCAPSEWSHTLEILQHPLSLFLPHFHLSHFNLSHTVLSHHQQPQTGHAAKKKDKLLTMDASEITYEMVAKKLREIVTSRGRKGTDKHEQVIVCGCVWVWLYVTVV